MNKFQAAFLASLLLTFTSLVLLLHYLHSRLVAAGYNISHLILIGLPHSPPPINSGRVTMVDIQDFLDTVSNINLKAVDIPGLGTYDLIQVASSPVVVITAAVVVATAVYTTVVTTGTTKKTLNPAAWQEYPLLKKIQVSPNTAIYRFKLPNPKAILGLPTGQHISVSAEINGKDVLRSYTPISSDQDRGHFDLLIKSYEKGNISRLFSLLKLGDNIRVKGPKGNFKYAPDLASHISMIAGGTGITPMYQIICAALRNPSDKTTLSLIYANVNPEDILLKDDLEQLVAQHANRFKLFYVLNNPPPVWNGGVGFITKEHISKHLPNPPNSKLLICGPPPMVTAMKKNLDELKYPAPRTVSKLVDQVFVF